MTDTDSAFNPKHSRKQKRLNRFFGFVEFLPTSDRILLKLLIVLTAAASIWLLFTLNASTLISVPKKGGTLVEGIVGTPRFINPLLAVTNADKDMVALLYSGLMKLGPDGMLIPDMAESITISDDGLIYNVVLREGLTFHDGTPVTADDIIFSVSRIQDPLLKSPLIASWEGVATEKISDRELNFVLEQQYAPFIENLTLGILPKHIWEYATVDEFPFSQFNSEPVGSGPYKLEKIVRNSGIPETYLLTPYTEYYDKDPSITSLHLVFFSNEGDLLEALVAGNISSTAGLSHESLQYLEDSGMDMSKLTLYTSPLPRTFTVFLNQNETQIFRDKAVREALNAAINRDRIVSEVLGDFGEPILDPIPPGFGVTTATTTSSSTLENIEHARDILRDGGWKVNEETGLWEKKSGEEVRQLSFSIATANSEVFERTADILKQTWEELGALVDIKKFEQTDLTQTVIRPRKYEALLFGTVVGRELDFYSFWHSSQRNDPGLNVALYANITTDSILTDVRAITSFKERERSYERFAEEIRSETPAIFLYIPYFTYIIPSSIENVDLKGIATPHERFSTITKWHVETEPVWPFFRDASAESNR